jgi:aryl-phospho-beta-D-glucosidase BglC (GH1 family)
MVGTDLNISIPEFTVAGVPFGSFFAHQWYVATDDQVDSEDLRKRIDQKIKELNDDYEVERRHALKDIMVTVLPESTFMEFMEAKGKVGGQHKFPRVIKGKVLEDWQNFLKGEKIA